MKATFAIIGVAALTGLFVPIGVTLLSAVTVSKPDKEAVTPEQVEESAGGEWRKPKNPYVGQKIDWTFDKLKICFYESGNINIFGKCKGADAAIAGKVRVRGHITDVSEFNKDITIQADSI